MVPADVLGDFAAISVAQAAAYRRFARKIEDQIKEALMAAPQKQNDPLSPSYYSRFAIQPIEFIVKNGLDFLQGNVIKYVCRFDQKNGIEDLKKARSNLDKMIEREEARAAAKAADDIAARERHLRLGRHRRRRRRAV